MKNRDHGFFREAALKRWECFQDAHLNWRVTFKADSELKVLMYDNWSGLAQLVETRDNAPRLFKVVV